MKFLYSVLTFLTLVLLPSVVFAQEGTTTDMPAWLVLLATVTPLVVTAAIVPFLGWAGKKLSSAAESKIKNETLRTATSKMTTVVFGVVSALAQELADEWKKASEDGKLTQEEKDKLKAIAVSRAKSLLSGDTWDVLTSEYGGDAKATNVVEDQIEAAVRTSKLGK